MENTLVPVNSGRKDKEGNELYNISLKTVVDKKTGKITQGLVVGDSIVVEKLFPGGYKTQYDWSIKAKYQDKVCSFWIKREDEYLAFESCGGIGDKVRISAVSIPYSFKDKKTQETVEGVRIGYTFELVA